MSARGGNLEDLKRLKPCPLCGGDVYIKECNLIGYRLPRYPTIKCERCEVVFSFDEPHKYASSPLGYGFSLIEAFNRRCINV